MDLPPLFIERLRQILPSGVDYQGWFGPMKHKVFRLNPLRARPDDLWPALEATFHAQPIEGCPLAFAVPSAQAPALLDSAFVQDGRVYAQGLESMLAVVALDPQPGQAVLDLCAAPGSKTTQIAALMNNEGTLIANEPVRDRFYRLKAVTDLLGARATLKMTDGRYLRMEPVFDRILVDAPCSSEGRFRKEDSKTFGYWSLRKIHEMAHKQKGLLLNASRLLKPGGVLVYTTCTFAPEENEAVVDWFLRKSGGRFSVEALHLPQASTYPALLSFQDKPFDPQVARACRILPGSLTEGFFITKFVCS